MANWSNWSLPSDTDLAENVSEEWKNKAAAFSQQTFNKSLDDDLLDYLFTMIRAHSSLGEVSESILEVSDLTREESQTLCKWILENLLTQEKPKDELSEAQIQLLEMQEKVKQLEKEKRMLENEKKMREKDQASSSEPTKRKSHADNEDLSKLSVDALYYAYLAKGFNGDFFQFQDLAKTGSRLPFVAKQAKTETSPPPSVITPQEFAKKAESMTWSRTPTSTASDTPALRGRGRGGKSTAHNIGYVKPGFDAYSTPTNASGHMTFVKPGLESNPTTGGPAHMTYVKPGLEQSTTPTASNAPHAFNRQSTSDSASGHMTYVKPGLESAKPAPDTTAKPAWGAGVSTGQSSWGNSFSGGQQSSWSDGQSGSGGWGSGVAPRGGGFAPRGSGFTPRGSGFTPRGSGFTPRGRGGTRGRGRGAPFAGNQQWVRSELNKTDSLSDSLPATP